MSHDAHAAEIDSHVRRAMVVFGALMVLTVLTVAVSYLDLSVPMTIAVALIIALTKGTLVCLYFMHLISERFLIYFFLSFTVIFFFGLLLLPIFTSLDVPHV